MLLKMMSQSHIQELTEEDISKAPDNHSVQCRNTESQSLFPGTQATRGEKHSTMYTNIALFKFLHTIELTL